MYCGTYIIYVRGVCGDCVYLNCVVAMTTLSSVYVMVRTCVYTLYMYEYCNVLYFMYCSGGVCGNICYVFST